MKLTTFDLREIGATKLSGEAEKASEYPVERLGYGEDEVMADEVEAGVDRGAEAEP